MRESAHRIVSLIPSTTEIVCALGLQDALVGRSHECDHPPGVRDLPACTAPRFADGTSHEIDDRVRDLVRGGLSVYDVHAELLRALRPTVILTQDQCEVCAASLAEVEAAVCDWIDGDARIVSLSPATLGDVWGDIARIGQATDRSADAEALVTELTERVTEIGERSGPLPRPRVACIEWFEPLMTAGNWIPEVVALAGGANLFGEAGTHSPYLEWSSLVEADPEVLVLMPCGFDIARSRAELPALLRHPAWSSLRAVREGRVCLADGNAYFNRPGPRLVESIEILAEILHPEHFDFGHRGPGRGWEPAD